MRQGQRMIDIIVTKFFPLCFKMAERFENLDILRDWVTQKENIQKTVSFLQNGSEKYISSLIQHSS